MDLHAPQIQGFFDVPVDHLYAAPVLNQYFAEMDVPRYEMVVVSPDEGSIKRALGHAKRLKSRLAIVDKRRSSAEDTHQENIIGAPVDGKVAVIFDDLISTAGSICGAAQKLKSAGAREIWVAATHGVFCGPAMERIANAPITRLVITDTIPLKAGMETEKIEVLSIAPLLGEAIKRIHRNESVSELFD
jgi:ribose-phosphate pyrophosphokinase